MGNVLIVGASGFAAEVAGLFLGLGFAIKEARLFLGRFFRKVDAVGLGTGSEVFNFTLLVAHRLEVKVVDAHDAAFEVGVAAGEGFEEAGERCDVRDFGEVEVSEFVGVVNDRFDVGVISGGVDEAVFVVGDEVEAGLERRFAVAEDGDAVDEGVINAPALGAHFQFVDGEVFVSAFFFDDFFGNGDDFFGDGAVGQGVFDDLGFEDCAHGSEAVGDLVQALAVFVGEGNFEEEFVGFLAVDFFDRKGEFFA